MAEAGGLTGQCIVSDICDTFDLVDPEAFLGELLVFVVPLVDGRRPLSSSVAGSRFGADGVCTLAGGMGKSPVA